MSVISAKMFVTTIVFALGGCVQGSDGRDSLKTLTIDCIPTTPGCEEIIVEGDPYASPPAGYPDFSGHADPSIRKDPNSNTLWLGYSHPHYKQVEGSLYAPSVAIHLATSIDDGDSWTFVKTLWEPVAMSNPANPGQQGYLDHETINLLPVDSGGTTTWYAARLNYFIPDSGGFNARPTNSYHISVIKAISPSELSTGEVTRIGGTLTSSSWNASILVPPELSSASFFWNEPALYYEDGTLYLMMVAFVYFAGEPDFPKNNVFIYSTSPEGSPADWNWSYRGKLVGEEEATELGGLRLTQTDLVKGTSGQLLLLGTPDDWNSEKADFNHKGNVLVEVESLNPPKLARSKDGRLRVRAILTVSDANELGSGAGSYDPFANTGIILTRRNKTSTELTASLWKTGLKP